MERTIIITSYMDDPLDLQTFLQPEDFIICLDGGYDIALQNHVTPHLLLGDFDSIQAALPHDIEICRFPAEKDDTDLGLALELAVRRKKKHVEILGGIGGRLDHTIANMQLLSHYSGSFDVLRMRDGRNKCFVISGHPHRTHRIPKEKNSQQPQMQTTELQIAKRQFTICNKQHTENQVGR